MGAKEWAQRLETLLETGELAGWAGIGFLLINPTSQNLGPNWGSVSVRGREDKTHSCLRLLPGCERSALSALEARGIFSGLVFLGTGLMGCCGGVHPRRDSAVAACRRHAPGAQD